MAAYVCEVCGYVYEDDREDVAFESLDDAWTCPVCGSKKEVYTSREASPEETPQESVTSTHRQKYLRDNDEFEHTMADIHHMATTGEKIIEPMRTQAPTFSWDEILIKGAQLYRLPLDETEPVSLKTTIGPNARVPLVIDSPVFVTHMSFGALSREAKVALSRGSATAKTALQGCRCRPTRAVRSSTRAS